ncbi:hypothetical protein [Candidatus Accumulibacter sp. ACC003]|uniref:hypothetical protein n=1 Tax=Candidatus Accumulibacter sp. ACC003 TaxID=2823334 RepID=UPI0025C0DB27|nr:hypothetical protein [Candidatus Accumulibacter sp. ACC003]
MLNSKKMLPFAALSRRLWEHSIYVAALSRVLARKLTRVNPDEAVGVDSRNRVFSSRRFFSECCPPRLPVVLQWLRRLGPKKDKYDKNKQNPRPQKAKNHKYDGPPANPGDKTNPGSTPDWFLSPLSPPRHHAPPLFPAPDLPARPRSRK